jgi:serine/threonine protein kinase
MLRIPRDDDALSALLNVEIPSSLSPGVRYQTERMLAEGGMAVALYALRSAPDGQAPVVLKILRPSFVADAGRAAMVSVQKEAVALGRLNERVPPVPFVVRLVDTGTFAVEYDGKRIELPWLAVEYVHGGTEGTTLTQRVEHAMRVTGFAFDPERSARAIDALAKGLAAVHEVGVVHRDIKPDNILCCGFGEEEVFKVADFGLARPSGVAGTFGGQFVGTPGYAPSELLSHDANRMGPWTDVFSFAAVVYFLLTGEDYFPTTSVAGALARQMEPGRRSILEAPALSPELRARVEACKAIDALLAQATAFAYEQRPRSAALLAAALLKWLRGDSRRNRPASRRAIAIVGDDTTSIHGWTWITRWNPGSGDVVVRQVAWEGDGRCLAATTRGLSFWTGTEWQDAPVSAALDPTAVRFVRRVGPGRWLLGGDRGTLVIYTTEGLTEVERRGERTQQFVFCHGDLDDVAVLVSVAAGKPPTLHTVVAGRWLKPRSVPEASTLTSIARVDDECWLLTGRGRDKRAFAALFRPLDWDLEVLEAPRVRALMAAAGQPERHVGLAVGADSAVLWRNGGSVAIEAVSGGFDLSAAGVDVVGRGWAASAGRIWLRSGGRRRARWSCVWADSEWTSPIVSLFADVGVVLAVTADGGIVEGRLADLRLSDTMRTAYKASE